MKTLLMGFAALAIAAPAAAITVTVEAPGLVNSTDPAAKWVETFDGAGPAGVKSGFTTDFGGSPFTGSYTDFYLSAADQYGGAGGTGFYPDADNANGIESYTLTLDPSANYFGFWLSALHPGNEFSVTFSGAAESQTFNYDYFIGKINERPDAADYFGGGSEAFAFFNFYMAPNSYNTLTFSQVGGGGFETDNHTVAFVPEPATWAMLIAGFGMVGFAARRRRTRTITA